MWALAPTDRSGAVEVPVSRVVDACTDLRGNGEVEGSPVTRTAGEGR